MKTARLALLAAATAGVAIAQTATTAPSAPAAVAPAAPAKPAAPASFADALVGGKVSVNARLRYEGVDQDNLNDADALTLRLRVGYTTALYKGFQAMVEGEANVPLVDNYFDGTGTNPGGYATVADPEIYEINQAWVAYSNFDSKAQLGRQRIVLDNARFVGDVGWRQNQQTFDSVLVQNKSLEKLTVTYAYLSRINRIFDDSAGPTAGSTQYDWQSDSHLVNAAYSGLPFGTLVGYGYLLDFDEINDGAINASNQTYGLSFTGSAKLTDKLSLLYRAEYATQSDYGSSVLSYTSDYYALEAGPKFGKYSLVGGYEVLGSDDGKAGSGFKTPLATLHAFNGWADKFLATPDAGLEDLYLKASAALPANLSFLGMYHWFQAEDTGVNYGTELDLQLTYKFNKSLSFTAKTAYYNADSDAPAGALSADTNKYWLQADYSF